MGTLPLSLLLRLKYFRAADGCLKLKLFDISHEFPIWLDFKLVLFSFSAITGATYKMLSGVRGIIVGTVLGAFFRYNLPYYIPIQNFRALQVLG